METLNNLLGISQHDLLWYQTALRAVAVFVIAMITIYVAGMRSFGSKTPFDVVVSITLGAVLSRCITGHYPILPCVSAAFALSLCHRSVAFFTHRFAIVRKVTEGEGICLFKEGKPQWSAINKYLITAEDLRKAIREQGLDGAHKVDSIWYEIDGKISVIPK